MDEIDGADVRWNPSEMIPSFISWSENVVYVTCYRSKRRRNLTWRRGYIRIQRV